MKEENKDIFSRYSTSSVFEETIDKIKNKENLMEKEIQLDIDDKDDFKVI